MTAREINVQAYLKSYSLQNIFNNSERQLSESSLWGFERVMVAAVFCFADLCFIILFLILFIEYNHIATTATISLKSPTNKGIRAVAIKYLVSTQELPMPPIKNTSGSQKYQIIDI